ncbi:hypothetical protein ACI782_03995 [Geodermatophilus sp. SYSU D00703]
MDGPRPVLPLVPVPALLVAALALAACGTGVGGPGAPLPHVAAFALGGDTPEAREFVLTPVPGPDIQVLPEPSPAPPSPDLGEYVPTRPPADPWTPPDPGGWPSFQPSVAWVNDGRYLAVVTFGSSSCPSGPYGIEVVAEQEIEIRIGPLFADRDVCSADMSGHVTVVEVPQGITPTKPLRARFGEREVTIPAVGR